MVGIYDKSYHILMLQKVEAESELDALKFVLISFYAKEGDLESIDKLKQEFGENLEHMNMFLLKEVAEEYDDVLMKALEI